MAESVGKSIFKNHEGIVKLIEKYGDNKYISKLDKYNEEKFIYFIDNFLYRQLRNDPSMSQKMGKKLSDSTIVLTKYIHSIDYSNSSGAYRYGKTTFRPSPEQYNNISNNFSEAIDEARNTYNKKTKAGRYVGGGIFSLLVTISCLVMLLLSVAQTILLGMLLLLFLVVTTLLLIKGFLVSRESGVHFKKFNISKDKAMEIYWCWKNSILNSSKASIDIKNDETEINEMTPDVSNSTQNTETNKNSPVIVYNEK